VEAVDVEQEKVEMMELDIKKVAVEEVVVGL
jgi:hypothetical protein